MGRYARTALPWTAVATVGVLDLLLLEVVRRWPYTMWPLEGCAVGLLAAGTAWCFDEPAAAVTDVAPRGLGWRTSARSAGGVVLAAGWILAVVLSRRSLFGHALDVGSQGLAAIIASAAIVTAARARGAATPGRTFAAVAVPLCLFVALARPLNDVVAVFPYATDDWRPSRVLWSTGAVGGLVVLVVVLHDLRWRRARPAGRVRTPCSSDRAAP